MTQKQIWASVALVLVLSYAIVDHAYEIGRTRDGLALLDPSFIRIVKTTNSRARCGRFESAQNRASYPDGERFYWVGSRLYLDRQVQAAARAGHPISGFPNCSGVRQGGWIAVLSDPFLLPVVGVSRRTSA